LIEILTKVKTYCKISTLKKSTNFWAPIFLGILFKLNGYILFIAPITAIKSISDGNLSSQIKKILQALLIPLPKEDNLFFFFASIISFSLISLFTLNYLKNFYVWRIKNNLLKKIKNGSSSLNKNRSLEFKKKVLKVDAIINNTENIIFCLILIIFIILYDVQISLIVLGGGIIYYEIIQMKNQKKINQVYEKTIKVRKVKNKEINYLLNSNISDHNLIKPLTSTSVMLLIMLTIFTRPDPSISIIFIFLVRIYQNQMLKSIESLVKIIKK